MDMNDDGKAGYKERSAAVGREAALQRQLQELSRSYQDLVKRYEAKDQKCDELRSKLTGAKAALSTRERELETAQRMLQKLNAEKNQLKEEHAERQVYTRRLEAKLEELQATADLSSKYHAMKQKVSEHQQQLASLMSELTTCQDISSQQQKEVDRLSRALEIRALELSDDFGVDEDVAAQLLHSVAESREESLSLAKQLAACKSELQKLKASSSKLSSKLEAEQLLRTDAEAAAEQLKQRLEKLLESSQEASKHKVELAQDLAASKSAAQALKAERDELTEVVLEMQEEVEQLKAAMTQAAELNQQATAAAVHEAHQKQQQMQAEAESVAAQLQQREAMLNQRCCQLAAQASQLEAALQEQLLAAQQAAATRQQQIAMLERQLQTRREREEELEHRVAELQLQAQQLNGAASSAEAAARQSSHLDKQVARLEAALRVASVERQQLQQRLQQLGDDAAAEQQQASREADTLRAQVAVKEAAHRCALEDNAELQRQLEGLRQQLDEAATAKAQLQQSMLQQINCIKQKLHQAEQQTKQQLPSSLPSSPPAALKQYSSSKQDQGIANVLTDDYARSPSRAVRQGKSSRYGALGLRSSSSPGSKPDWGSLSAAGYVNDTAAATIDAMRRGKTVAAVRRLQLQPGKSVSAGETAAGRSSSARALWKSAEGPVYSAGRQTGDENGLLVQPLQHPEAAYMVAPASGSQLQLQLAVLSSPTPMRQQQQQQQKQRQALSRSTPAGDGNHAVAPVQMPRLQQPLQGGVLSAAAAGGIERDSSFGCLSPSSNSCIHFTSTAAVPDNQQNSYNSSRIPRAQQRPCQQQQQQLSAPIRLRPEASGKTDALHAAALAKQGVPGTSAVAAARQNSTHWGRLQAPVEPYSPSVALRKTGAKAPGQLMTDPYSLPTSTEPSAEMLHGDPQQFHLGGGPEQLQPAVPAAATSGISPHPAASSHDRNRRSAAAHMQQQQQLLLTGAVDPAAMRMAADNPRPSRQPLAAGQVAAPHTSEVQAVKEPAGYAAGRVQLDSHHVEDGTEHSSSRALQLGWPKCEASREHSRGSSILDQMGAWEVPQLDSDSGSDHGASLLDTHSATTVPGMGQQEQGQQQQLRTSGRCSSTSTSSGSSHSKAQPPSVPRPGGSTAAAPRRKQHQALGASCSDGSSGSTGNMGRASSYQAGGAQDDVMLCSSSCPVVAGHTLEASSCAADSRGQPSGNSCRSIPASQSAAASSQAASNNVRCVSDSSSSSSNGAVSTGPPASKHRARSMAQPPPAAAIAARQGAEQGQSSCANGANTGLWSPPSTGKVARGGRGPSQRSKVITPVPLLQLEGGDLVTGGPEGEGAAGVEHADGQLQQQQQLSEWRQQRAGSSSRLYLNPSLASWTGPEAAQDNATLQQHDTGQIQNGAAAGNGRSSSTSSSRHSSVGAGSIGSNSSSSIENRTAKMDALLAKLQDGDAPTLQDLADLEEIL